ncbi:VOC family protein [Francisella philomiragia]|uniref:VOC family protein n=1 Tax=Francisella philomiragia TaxID=28110 RepID=UPI001908A4DE|nr:VOC family protein [Francisella philomiragia]MBK2092490.1 VOC family protein [Francisella philomiragia]MBK2257204.1 VOC family protein [Francisella philomiragia]MBK2269861.1 VOC family protein [Francisella philomiragia]MBK2271793.1 VOC family protein [Francisella philomiragia]MBK2275580.1 VOC family protein [Francisella philomiragia]
MRIEHIAIWVKDIELMKDFYCKYFNAKPNDKYINPVKGFSSYFLSFKSGARLEIMHSKNMNNLNLDNTERFGLIHLAISVGSKEKVDQLTEQLRNDGFKIIGESRITGDGYYESCVLDPEQNLIEITI